MKKIILNLKTILIIVFCLSALLVVFFKNTYNTKNTYFMMDTLVTIEARGFNSKDATEKAYSRLKEIEDKMTSHKSTSKLSQKEFDDDLLQVLKKGVYYGDVSGGLFDVTVKPLTDLWDITSSAPKIPTESEILNAKEKVNYKNILINGNNVTVPVGCEIDLGGIAKGYAADEAAKILKESGINDAVINLGGNVYALGKKKIGIQNPSSENGDYIGILQLENCSVATSGGYERYFVKDGKTYHHIINPFTGYPCETDLLAATVVSSYSIDADSLATIFFMVGKDKAVSLAKELKADYVLIDNDKNVYYSENLDFEITNNDFKPQGKN